MGPSGAGKTVLLNALTLDATFGKTTGSCKLNGVPVTKKIFEEHCYVVQQKDVSDHSKIFEKRALISCLYRISSVSLFVFERCTGHI